jgi:hypothetical protein
MTNLNDLIGTEVIVACIARGKKSCNVRGILRDIRGGTVLLEHEEGKGEGWTVIFNATAMFPARAWDKMNDGTHSELLG